MTERKPFILRSEVTALTDEEHKIRETRISELSADEIANVAGATNCDTHPSITAEIGSWTPEWNPSDGGDHTICDD
ncbi:hypothetical protein RMQ97_07935 [Maricaulis sp. D1M11]|uniref:hypothetical protein n=1 Tax=Maricaulis sp. D1M11 TaxID=3076117 RepID=UPI0039B3E352